MNKKVTKITADDPISIRNGIKIFYQLIKPLKYIEVSFVIKREEGMGYVTEIIRA